MQLMKLGEAWNIRLANSTPFQFHQRNNTFASQDILPQSGYEFVRSRDQIYRPIIITT